MPADELKEALSDGWVPVVRVDRKPHVLVILQL